MAKTLNTLYSFLYWFVFACICVPLFLINLVTFFVTLPFDRNGVVVHLFSCFWSWLELQINPFWRFDIRGRENIKWGKTYVLVSNHQSYFDVFTLFCLFRPYKWLAKDILFNIPFIGWNMRLNRYVSIKRSSPESRAQALEECRQWLRRGMSVIIFPEGTRSESGEMRDFHSGAFRLAIQEKIPIIPIAVNGTRHILKKNSMRLNGSKAVVNVRVLPAIETAAYSEEQVNELKDLSKSRIEETLRQI